MKQKILVKLFESMKHSKGFPALETTVASVMTHLRDKSLRTDAIVEPIVSDFAMTQKVLNLVNSAMYAPFAKDISSVSKALQIIGNDALSHIVISVSLMPTPKTGEDADDDLCELSKTLLASELARSVSSTGSMEKMATAALVYNLGTLVADKFLPEEMWEAKKLVEQGVEPDKAYHSVFGMTLTQLGVEVAARWKFPQDLVSIIDGTGDTTLVKVAQFSNTGAQLIYENRTEELNTLVASLDIPELNKEKLTAKIQEKVAARSRYVTKVAVKTQTSERILTALLCDVHANLPSKITDLARSVFSAVSSALKTEHCLLFMLIKTGEYKIIFANGKGVDEIKSRFKIPAEFSPNAFHAVARNNVDIAINNVARLKSNALPALYSELMPDTQSFIILPITNGGVSGMLYYDWSVHTELSTIELGLLRKIRDLFLPFFPPVEKLADK